MLSAAVVILAVLLVGVRLAGIRVYTVLSGSMEPAYHVGSLIYVKPVSPEMLKAGDVITFMLNQDTVVTHRIAQVLPDADGAGLRFVTKGDANETEDAGWVYAQNVIGRAVVTIPYLGYLSAYIQRPPGSCLAVAFCAALLLISFLSSLLKPKPKSPEQAEGEKEGFL